MRTALPSASVSSRRVRFLVSTSSPSRRALPWARRSLFPPAVRVASPSRNVTVAAGPWARAAPDSARVSTIISRVARLI